MEVTINQTPQTSGESVSYAKKDAEARPHTGPNARVIEDQQRFYTGGPEVQKMAPPTVGHYSHPPPTRTGGDTETAAMLDCICQCNSH